MEKTFSTKRIGSSSESCSCFNMRCKAPLSSPPPPPPNGWLLNSGQYSTLCEGCARSYTKRTFCGKFHSEQAGWRNCNVCNKSVHCACIVSKNNYVFHDDEGVVCVNCSTKIPEINRNENLPVSVERPRLLTWGEDFQSKDKPAHTAQDLHPLDDVMVLLREALNEIEAEDLHIVQQHPADQRQMLRDQTQNTMTGPSNAIAPAPHVSDGNRVRKHPGHRSDCTCIVCRQPSRGNRHPLGCNCDVCDAYRRRRETFSRNRNKKKQEGADEEEYHEDKDEWGEAGVGPAAAPPKKKKKKRFC